MKKILYMTNLPVPYKIEFFKELAKMIDLTVVFERREASDRNSKWLSSNITGFRPIFLEGKKCGNEAAFCPGIINIIKKGNYDEIVVGCYHTLTGMLAIQYMKLKGIQYYISSDGGFVKNDNTLKRKVKSYFMAGAKGYFSPGMKTDEYLIHYGAKNTKVFRYPFTSLKYSDLIEYVPGIDEKMKLKKKLGIEEEKMILGVGQFIYRKGWDVLIQAMKYMPNNVGVYIVGGNITAEYSEYKQKYSLKNLHFIEFKEKEELAQYYCAADIFCLPTREDIWGLVINEAMGYGLPVVTTDRCMAGLEMICNGENGYIVPVDNIHELADKLNYILTDNNCRSKMGEHSIMVARNYIIEKMVENYLKVLRGNNVR